MRSTVNIVAQLDLGDFLAPLEHLLEDAHQVDQRDHQLALSAFVVVERKIGLGPDMGFELLLLVEQLRGVLELLVLDQAVHQFGARVDLLLGPPSGSGGKSIFDLIKISVAAM